MRKESNKMKRFKEASDPILGDIRKGNAGT
jgi:hypothetical protein